MLWETCNRLACQEGEVVILLAHSCYRNRTAVSARIDELSMSFSRLHCTLDCIALEPQDYIHIEVAD